MKELILILFLCSATNNTCLPPYQWPVIFNDPYECMLKGYEEAFIKTQEIGRAEVNKERVFIKFECLETNILIPKEKPGLNL